MSDKDITMDDLLLEDYLSARRYLRAYANRLRENRHIRVQDPEWADTIEEVTEALADQLDEALDIAETNVLFNRIVGPEKWED